LRVSQFQNNDQNWGHQ